MKNLPKEIYLQTGSDTDEQAEDFKELYEVTWSEGEIQDGDTKYILADSVTQLIEAAREAKAHIEALAGIIKQEPFQKLFDALKPFEK